MTNRAKICEIFGITLLFVGLAVFHFWHNLPFKPGLLRSYSDQLLHVWILGWDGWAIFHQPFSIFNANINFPAPDTLALSDHMLGLLPNWFIGYLISGDYTAAHNYAYMIARIISGVGAYFYFRCWKLRPVTCLLGAAFFAFFLHPSFIEEIQLASFGYAFWVFLFLEKYLREGKKHNLVLMSAFYMMGFLTGFYLAFMLTLAIAVYLAVSLAVDRKLLNFNKLFLIILVFMLSVLVLSPTIYPYINLYRAHVLYGATIQNLAHESRAINNINFITRMTITLLFGVYLLWRRNMENRRGTVIFLTIAVIFHLLSLGPYLKIGDRATSIPLPYLLFHLIPGFMTVRIVWRYTIMAFVGDAFIITATLDALLPHKDKFKFTLRNISRAVAFAIIAFFVIRPLKPLSSDEYYSPIPYADNLPAIYRHLASSKEPGPIVEFPMLPSMKHFSYVYQYFSLFHHRQLFNGNSGYTPYGIGVMYNGDLSPEEWVTYFRTIGVKFIVSHPPDFIVRIIETSGQTVFNKPPPLPHPDPKKPNTTIWMNPIENAIYMNGLKTPDMNSLIQIFGFNIFETSHTALVPKDEYIIDLGHDMSKLVQPMDIPELPVYATKNGNVLSIAHRDLGKLIADMGTGTHYVLLRHGIDRIEVHGFRYLFEENIRNPFLNLNDSEAQMLGLSRVAEADGSVIWRIEPASDIKLILKPEIHWEILSVDNGVLKMETTMTVAPQTVWKNPNSFGTDIGHIEFDATNQNKVSKYDFQINMPIVITEHRPFKAQTLVKTRLASGSYRATIEFPEPKPQTSVLSVQISPAESGAR